MKRAFLKAPLKYGYRISSKYNKNRLHPVLKVNRPHLGTDYAAAHGTPIITVGDGVVVEASFTKGNGNYVKVKHNGTYTTQYLHMSKFAKGIKPGKRVSQGDVIGYVGSTGLATGPHVCFRFWKNGVQVDPFKVLPPPAEPVAKKNLESFNTMVDRLKKELEGINPELTASLN
jgi:murein DD-endopeptidase MepM/ murein hydrolase activator NlpD